MSTPRRRTATPTPPIIEVKEFSSFEEIARAIAKLQKRIADVRALDPRTVPFSDQIVKNVETNIQETIREIYGQNSPEFQKHKHHDIWSGGMNIMDSMETRQRHFAEGIPQTIAMLEGLITRLEERKEDFQESPKSMANASFNGLSLHSRVASVCADRFRDGHYEDAVLSAAKVLVNFVKEKSGSDLDGAPLMRTVFSKHDPILAFNDLSDQSDMDEQEGMMHLFEGAVLALRNPRAHSFPSDSPDRALEYIAFISLLANKLEESKRRK
jgi:uncharacterized protein (TIGR02391 family)